MGKTSKEALQKRAKAIRTKKTLAVIAVCLLLCNTILLAYFDGRKKIKIEQLTKQNTELNATVNELQEALRKNEEEQRKIINNVETMINDTKNLLENIIQEKK